MTAPRVKLLIGGLALAAATAACGRQSALARPAPLFGEQAKADYQADQAAAARAAARRDASRRAARGTTPAPNTRGTSDTSATDSSSVNPDNAPPTTRDVRDPAQNLAPLSSAPAAGAPDPLGPPVSVTPPELKARAPMEAGFRRASDGALLSDGVPLRDIARDVGTPVYVHSGGALRTNYTRFRDAFGAPTPLIAYAVKANGSLAVLRTLAVLGAGADTVSQGEARRALAAGVPAERIVFSGVGKTDAELAFALDARLGCINVESEAELERLSALAAVRSAAARVALRVNPGVGAGGHSKITTGLAASKFGVALTEVGRLYARAHADPHLEPIGLACHIGSQIADLAPLEAAWTALRDLAVDLRRAGLPVRRLDLGGGLGADYGHGPAPPGPEAFAALAARVFAGVEAEFAFEPGRVIAASAGVLLASVVHVNVRPDGRRFLVLDAGMNDLVRPALYDAWHTLEPVEAARTGELQPYDVVGPVCESGDTFALQRDLAPLAAGDVVAFMTAGAYGSAMASEYNSRPLAPEAFTDAGRWTITRARPTYETLLARERLPAWLA